MKVKTISILNITITKTHILKHSQSGVQDGGHMYTHGWFMSMYGKNHHIIVK